MKTVALLLWQLPQILFGLVIAAFLLPWSRGTRAEKGTLWIETALRIGVSFGPIILLWRDASARIRAHEYGHSLQSRILGPLYLPVVGIPSFMRALVWGARKLPAASYYLGYPENWADRLGGVSGGPEV